MDYIFVLLFIWTIFTAICAVVGFAVILSNLISVPIGAAAVGGMILLLTVIPVVVFLERRF